MMIKNIVTILKEGGVVIFPTETVYGLACRYDSSSGIKRIKEIKNRDKDKPLPYMVSNIDMAQKISLLDFKSRFILSSFTPGPLTLIVKGKNVTEHKDGTIAIRIPDKKDILEIIDQVGVPLLVTSANYSNEPPVFDKKELQSKFSNCVDYIMFGEQSPTTPSTIASCCDIIKVIREGVITQEELNDKMKTFKIAIGCDHGAFLLKQSIIEHLKDKYSFIDFGCYDSNSCNYAEIGIEVGEAVSSNQCEVGIVLCTSGIGISIAANKVKGVRCALVDNVTSARLCKEHNNANMIALGSSRVDLASAIDIIEVFLTTPFAGDRHLERVQTIIDYEKNQ